MPFNADNNQNNQNDPNKDQNQEQINLKGSGQGAASTPNSGRVANYSTGQQTGQTSGSGRFNNLQKYIGANQGAGENMGAKIGSTFDKNVNTQKSEFDKKNSNINMGLQQGRQTLEQGSGFNNQLKNIGNDLSTFKDMENRSAFDNAAKSAIDFQKNPNFNQFQTIQSGAGIDNDKALADASGLVTTGQNLNDFTQDKLSKIQTEQGRFDLLNSAYGNKKNYGAGSARFDQLLLQNTPGNVVRGLNDKFNAGNLESKQILNASNTQMGNVNTLLGNEVDLIGNINTQAQSNQDIFNTKLGDQNNINFINNLRDKKYNDYLQQLKSGNISEGVAKDLALDTFSTYNPLNKGQIQIGNEMDPGQDYMPGTLRTYNTDLANTAASYLKQGANAQNMQDITTQDDYDAYKALQNISGRDTGKLSGISNIGKSVEAGRNLQNQTLAEKIKAQDDAFRKDYAGRDYQVNSFATQSGPGGTNGHFGVKGGNSLASGVVAEGANNYGDFYNQIVQNNQGSSGSGATGYARANIDDYINRSEGALETNSNKAYDRGGDKESNRAAEQQARESSQAILAQHLNNIASQTGMKNTAQLLATDPNDPNIQAYKRFKGLI